MSHRIPLDSIISHYYKLFKSRQGRAPISGRIVPGAILIRHYLNLSDREMIARIQENMFMQYFPGYSTFTSKEPFSLTLFKELRERLTLELLSKINDVIAVLCKQRGEVATRK